MSELEATGVTPPPETFNFAAHLLALNTGRAAKPAFVDDLGSLGYGQLDERVRRLAAGLRGLGIKREERVLLLMQDVNDWPVAFLGAMYAGAVPVAVNTLLTADDYAYMLEHSRAQAVLVNRPLVVHEQNSIAGLANRVLAQVADRVLSGFPNVLKNSAWLGNPVRAEIASLPPPEQRFAGRAGPLRLLVIGGSLGAQALNQLVPQALALMPAGERPAVTHQAGAKHLDGLIAHYRSAGVEGELLAFIDDMAARYRDADVVICRAGALTVAELSAAGVASILVPFPHAVDDHQTHNARFLSEAGAAVLVQQRDLSARGLADQLLAFTRETLLSMASKARALGKPDAAGAAARVCMEAAR